VRFFYAPTNEGFSADIVARDAFLAGNDLLYLGNILSSDLDDTYATTVRILDFFAQRYREDPTFAQQVDEAVLRILTRKYHLFGDFQLSEVLAPANALQNIGQSQQLVYDVARRSATLVSPDPQELSSSLPSPPTLRDRLVFITDTVQSKQCSSCPVNSTLSLNSMQDAVVRLYGPTAAGQISAARLSSYTFDDLTVMLNSPDLETMASNIGRATWVVFLLSGSNKGQPELISRFLSERQDLLRDKRIILFSFTAPYYFDATDISKFSAYYCFYSKEPAFIDVAARLLFQELTPLGYSPVSIPGTGYDLFEVTSPNPDQVITLSLGLPPSAVPTNPPVPLDSSATPTAVPTAPPEPTAIPLFRIGDTIYVRTGVIYDHNNHSVPDGTVVQFTMYLTGQTAGISQQSEQTTLHGMAQASFVLENPGLVEIRATSDQATVSDTIRLDVSSGQPAAVTVIVPYPTETLEPTPILPTPVDEDPWVTPEGYPLFSSWILVILFVGLSAWLAYWVGSNLQSQRWGFRWGVCVLFGGLVGYNTLALGWLGSPQIVMAGGLGAILGMSALGELVGLGVGWMWSQRS
jgi:beta-N-acetylhexosaminidase